MPPMSRVLKKFAIWAALLLAGAVVAGAALQWSLSYLTLATTTPPGQLVDIGGRRLHMLCRGSGDSTVILEPGLPGSSLAWTSVTSAVAKFAKVCTYDRAGYGWSDAATTPRTASDIVEDLHQLLSTAVVDPPYVLVGHSFGGLVMQLYTSRYPDEVEGMVLVDSSHPDQVSQSTSLAEAEFLGRIIGALAPIGIPRLLFPVPAGSPETRNAAVRRLEKDLQRTTKGLHTAAAELRGLPESLRQVAAQRPDLEGMPLVVLSEGRRRAKFWHEFQEDLAKQSSASEWEVIDGAGHFIHHDRPEAVVSAIRRVAEAVQDEPT